MVGSAVDNSYPVFLIFQFFPNHGMDLLLNGRVDKVVAVFCSENAMYPYSAEGVRHDVWFS